MHNKNEELKKNNVDINAMVMRFINSKIVYICILLNFLFIYFLRIKCYELIFLKISHCIIYFYFLINSISYKISSHFKLKKKLLSYWPH